MNSKSKKLKYGSLSIVFTVVVIAAVLLLNLAFTALSEVYFWYTDMTEYQLYSLTGASTVLLDEFKDGDKEITIYFCLPFDRIVDESPTNSEYNPYLNEIYTFAQQYAAKYDMIKLDYIDIITNPTLVEKYTTTSTTRPKQTSLIVASEDDFRVFTIESLYSVSESSGTILAFSGEQKITSAILQLLGDRPTALFTTGHGETVGTQGSRPAIWNLLENAGYEVGTVDLTKEEIREGTQLVIINGPVYDFRGFGDSADEITKLGKFTDSRGSLMVFLSPDTPDLPELEDMLAEWGVEIGDAVIRDFTNSESTDGYKLVSEYPATGLGADLHRIIREYDSSPKAIVNYARPINIIWPSGENVTDIIGVRNVSPVLKSYATANAYAFGGSGETLSSGPYNLITLTRELNIINNQTYYSYVLVCGTMDFASEEYLYKNSFSNSDILYSAMKVMGKETVPLQVDYKWIEDNSLDITAGTANRWTVLIIIIIPAIVLGAGIFVAIRRKHL